MKKYGKTDAITLIALVVTVSVLLILSGITIMALTGENGLINKIKIVKEKHSESETEEKLKLKIMKLQTDIVEKEERQAVLEDLNNWTNLESDYYDYEITSVTDSQENTNKLVDIDGYIFEVDENLNIIGIIDANLISKTETTYQINSIDGDVMQVTIKIKNSSGIEKVINPLGKEIVPQTDKTQIGIDYEIVSGNNYTFKVKVSGSDEIKEYILKADINAKPEIEQNESYAYPVITEYGVEINKTVKIDYGENTNNYYSVDNGITWNKYDESFKIKNECVLIAKTVIEGEITRESKKEITLELASDTIGTAAFDGSDGTGYKCTKIGNHYIKVSQEMIGKKFRIKMYQCGNKTSYSSILALDESKSTIKTLFNGYNGSQGTNINNIYTIVEGTAYINIYGVGENSKQTIVYEIEPIIE